MEKQRHANLKWNKIHRRWAMLLVVAVIAIFMAGGAAFAKYYANNSSKGVAAASNYYFGSNVLSEKEDEQWKNVYNSDAWDGRSDYYFEVMVQNYQNQLLYNDQNLDVSYKITFRLLEDVTGYAVQFGPEERKNLTYGTEITYEGEIKGGMARADEYTIVFPKPEAVTENYSSAGVEVIAEITAPEYLIDQEPIGGVLYAGIVDTVYSLNGRYDMHLNSIGNVWSDSDKETLNAMAAFPYIISYTPGKDNSAHLIEVTWDAEKLQLNKFDNYFSDVRTTDGMSVVNVYIQPNETIEMIFYRTAGFEPLDITPDDFSNLISIKDLGVRE